MMRLDASVISCNVRKLTLWSHYRRLTNVPLIFLRESVLENWTIFFYFLQKFVTKY